MLTFKYNKKIDEENWKRVIKNGIKYGHKFPTSYEITQADIFKATKKVIEFQEIWNKYEEIFREKIIIIYKYDFPKNMDCFINSSPYSSFNPVKNYLSISMLCERNRLVPKVLHESSHFLFRKYYDDFCFSIGCTKEDIDKIKEFVTIINDVIFYPMQDGGWEAHKEYRQRALKVWYKTNNIKEVIKDAKKALDEQQN